MLALPFVSLGWFGEVFCKGKGDTLTTLKIFSRYPFRDLNWRTWYMKASRRVRVWVCSWPS